MLHSKLLSVHHVTKRNHFKILPCANYFLLTFAFSSCSAAGASVDVFVAALAVAACASLLFADACTVD